MKINIDNIIIKNKLKNKIFLLILIFILLLMFFISINLGKAKIGINEVIKILYAKLTFNNVMLYYLDNVKVTIIWEIRLPRILTAIIVGAGLAFSGIIFQALLINPLASPYTTGTSSGAALGAVIALYINLFIPGFKLPITVFAFIGALFALSIVIIITRYKGELSSIDLIIAGLIISLILQAIIIFIKCLSEESIQEILFWLMGSLAAKSWNQIFFIFLIITICIIICMIYSRDINIMCLGDKEAKIMGINSNRLRIILLICVSLITAVCVSVSGIIGFIGLIIPHWIRFFIGSDNKKTLPFSLLSGAVLLLFIDSASRIILNFDIPIGIITTTLGGLFFIYIFIKEKKAIY